MGKRLQSVDSHSTHHPGRLALADMRASQAGSGKGARADIPDLMGKRVAIPEYARNRVRDLLLATNIYKNYYSQDESSNNSGNVQRCLLTGSVVKGKIFNGVKR